MNQMLFASYSNPYWLYHAVLLVWTTVGVVSGLIAIQKNLRTFSHFTMADLIRRRLDAMLYATLSLSTAMCAIDVAVQLHWLLIGFPTPTHTEPLIRVVALSVLHLGIVSLSIAWHVTVNHLLRDADFCALCRRPK